ncbi:MAG: OFA family MFS transporter [Butyrivibrio sp.]|nr:OFA family MFS transporter [Butyrivibrio sp.]
MESHVNNKYIALIACLVVNLCLGSIYSWSVFSQAMTVYLNEVYGMSLNPGDLAIVYTIANSVGPITMIAGGWINDKFGPRNVIIVGGIMFGGGMFMAGFAKSVAYLCLTFGVIGGLGLGMAYGSVISTAIRLFPEKRGLMGGIATAAYGISSVIVPPVVSSIVAASSAPFAFKVTGAAFLIIIVSAAMFLGDIKTPVASTIKPVTKSNDKQWKDMLKMPVFYVMMLLLICGAFSGMMVISQASPIAVTMMGLSPANAAITVSVLALFNTAGRIVAGSLSDSIGRIGTLRLACVATAISELCLILSASYGLLLFFIGISIAGLSFGAFMGVYPGFTSDRFGLRNNSVNYGIMCIGFAFAGYIGPRIAKGTYDVTGSFKNAFVYAFVFSICGIVLTFIYDFIIRKAEKKC